MKTQKSCFSYVEVRWNRNESRCLEAKSRVQKISTVGNEWLAKRNGKEFEGYNCSPELQLKKKSYLQAQGWRYLPYLRFILGGGCGWRLYLTEEDRCDLSAQKWCALRCVNSAALIRLGPLPRDWALAASGPNALCCVWLAYWFWKIWMELLWVRHVLSSLRHWCSFPVSKDLCVWMFLSPHSFMEVFIGIRPKPTLWETLSKLKGIRKRGIQVVKKLDTSSCCNSW